MEQTPGAMKLRKLQTFDGLGAGPANTVVMFPVELTGAIEDIAKSVYRRNNNRLKTGLPDQ
jgi:hypothetical protein